MNIGKIFKIIGYIFFGIGVLARIGSRLSNGEMSEILSDYQFLKFIGFLFWVIGFAINEMAKKRTNYNVGNSELDNPSIKE
ncbi:hypothetical protein CLV90_1247 [Maribacter spongiicola]|uniref:Uncharacterized protein n=1 Tax=Maribacter spongiicola TaxID=1206753 RepID=A0A4R7K7A1_9FLAO|nr:hypothetical protein [Maribacter spongiicola]TDT47175.1 hypothetical protein CLV90_1247 [Maribacter spongiicola]